MTHKIERNKFENKLRGVLFWTAILLSIVFVSFSQPQNVSAAKQLNCDYDSAANTVTCSSSAVSKAGLPSGASGVYRIDKGSAVDGYVNYKPVPIISVTTSKCPESLKSDGFEISKNRKSIIRHYYSDSYQCLREDYKDVNLVINDVYKDIKDDQSIGSAGDASVYNSLTTALGSDLTKQMRDGYCKNVVGQYEKSECEASFKAIFGQCWASARTDLATIQRYDTTKKTDAEKQSYMHNSTAECLSKKTGVSKDKIFDKIKKLSATDISKDSDDAKQDKRDDIAAIEKEEDCIDAGYEWDDDIGCIDPNAGSSCTISGLGFIVCPIVNFLAEMADKAYEFIAGSFLVVPASMFDSSGGLFKAWQSFQSIANAILVILFLAIIFSQLTSVGISNYGLKKMLPRLVVMAILINVSFIISSLAVDLSNILGYGIKDLFNSMAINIGSVDDPEAYRQYNNLGSTGNGWFVAIASVVLAGGAAYVAGTSGIMLALVALIPVLITAVVALILIFFILVGRQVLIILLIAISPVAFALYLLPNTASWFTKWRKTFVALLMVFPVIGLVYGGSALASSIMQESVFKNTYDGGDEAVMTQIISAGIMMIPFLVVPSILKKSLDSVTNISGKLNAGIGSLQKGLSGKMGGSEFTKFQQDKRQNQKNEAKMGVGNSARARINRRMNEFAESGKGSDNWIRRTVGNRGRPSDFARHQQNQVERQHWSSSMEDARADVSTMSRDDVLEIATNGSADSAMRTAAYESLHASGGVSAKEESQIAATLKSTENNPVAVRENAAAKAMFKSPINKSPAALQAMDAGTFGNPEKQQEILEKFVTDRAASGAVSQLSADEMINIDTAVKNSSNPDLNEIWVSRLESARDDSTVQSSYNPAAKQKSLEIITEYRGSGSASKKTKPRKFTTLD